MSLTTGGTVPYSLCMTISFNFLFFADATDAVANNIFKKNSIKDSNPKSHSVLPHATEGVQPQDHIDVPSTKGPSFGQRMKGFFQHVGPHLWNAVKNNVSREMIEGLFLMGEKQ